MLRIMRELLGRITRIGWTFRFKGTGMTTFDVKTGGFKPQWIVIHHSWSRDSQIDKDWEGIRKFHTSWRYDGKILTEAEAYDLLSQGKKITPPWKDIGYQFGIESIAGKLHILEGRAIGEVGAHAKGFNANSIGVCLIGNFDPLPPSDEVVFTATSLCRDLQREFKIPRENVIGHRETFIKLSVPVEKSCPGKMCDMDHFRSMLIDV